MRRKLQVMVEAPSPALHRADEGHSTTSPGLLTFLALALCTSRALAEEEDALAAAAASAWPGSSRRAHLLRILLHSSKRLNLRPIVKYCTRETLRRRQCGWVPGIDVRLYPSCSSDKSRAIKYSAHHLSPMHVKCFMKLPGEIKAFALTARILMKLLCFDWIRKKSPTLTAAGSHRQALPGNHVHLHHCLYWLYCILNRNPCHTNLHGRESERRRTVVGHGGGRGTEGGRSPLSLLRLPQPRPPPLPPLMITLAERANSVFFVFDNGDGYRYEWWFQ